MPWRDYFAQAKRMNWQAYELPTGTEMPNDRVNSTEATYQAFKARFLEETSEPVGMTDEEMIEIVSDKIYGGGTIIEKSKRVIKALRAAGYLKGEAK